MHLVTLNCGSGTVRHALFEADREGVRARERRTVEVADDYRSALRGVLDGLPVRPEAVAHRVVHGGLRFRRPVRIDASVEDELRRLGPLAPLHNPRALEGIDVFRALGAPQVAVFDTAFHETLPARAWRYALPGDLPPEVRRYGFHGIACQDAVRRYASWVGTPEPTVVVLHLGGGCSATAVRKGCSIDTSMGFTPLEGLAMGTRCGDLDPGILLYLLRRGTSLDAVERLLWKNSGLQGLARSRDVRDLLPRGDPEARLALEILAYRARKYIGAYLAALDGAEAVLFTGGMGENQPEIRRRILDGLQWAGLVLDPGRNEKGTGRITTDASTLHAYVVPTDEERVIAEEALRCLNG